MHLVAENTRTPSTRAALMATLSLAIACTRPGPSTDAAKPPEPEPGVSAEPVPGEEVDERDAIEGGLKFEIGLDQGERCVIAPIDVELPLVAADRSEVVLMGRYDTYYDDGTDVLLQGLWHLAVDTASTYGDRFIKSEMFPLINWLGVDATRCEVVRPLAQDNIAKANDYLASKTWLEMEAIESVQCSSDRPSSELTYTCKTGTYLELCVSELGFHAVLLDPDWINSEFAWLYVNFQARVALAIQYEQGSDWYEQTAAEVFAIDELLAALPPEDRAWEEQS